VRLPASFCGLYGLRPTHGRIDVSGMVPLAPSFDAAGCFPASVRVMSSAAGVLSPGGTVAAARPRLFLAAAAWSLVAPRVAAALRPWGDRLSEIVGPAKPLRLSEGPLSGWREVFRICQAAEAWAVHGDWITARAPDFGPGVAERFAAASRITADEVAAAQARRSDLRQRLSGLLGEDGVVILPASPGPAPRRDADPATLDAYRGAALSLLCPAGLAGLPQLSIPAGRLDGAPVGLSLLGAAGSERTLLQIAERLEVCRTLPYTGI
ncbi:MAG: amidase family protein, partial [Kiloniellaceae bacterium]